MAFGIKREELHRWKSAIDEGEIAFLTHYWQDDRFPDDKTVTKVGAKNLHQLIEWGKQYNLKPEWIDNRPNYPHFDLIGKNAYPILVAEKQEEQIKRFF